MQNAAWAGADNLRGLGVAKPGRGEKLQAPTSKLQRICKSQAPNSASMKDFNHETHELHEKEQAYSCTNHTKPQN
jgi:hypothetical protein